MKSPFEIWGDSGKRVRRALARRNESLKRDARFDRVKRPRVVLLEPNTDRRRRLTEYLGRKFDVVAVASSQDALVTVKDTPCDVLVADRTAAGDQSGDGGIVRDTKMLLPHCAAVLYTSYPSLMR